MFLNGGGGGGSNWNLSTNGFIKYFNDYPANGPILLPEEALYFATKFKNQGLPIPLSLQRSLAAANIEIAMPGVLLQAANPLTQPVITVGLSTPQQQAAQSAAVQALVTPSPGATTPAPASSTLTTPTSNIATNTSADINWLDPNTPITPQSDNQTLLWIGGAVAVFLLLKKKKR